MPATKVKIFKYVLWGLITAALVYTFFAVHIGSQEIERLVNNQGGPRDVRDAAIRISRIILYVSSAVGVVLYVVALVVVTKENFAANLTITILYSLTAASGFLGRWTLYSIISIVFNVVLAAILITYTVFISKRNVAAANAVV